ncbi:MAG TPA: phosphonate ABC transporter substrate-binding protein [Chthoniobacterales bacterium]|nr:phosphonate ABC transporter substrate-binding protein [Chthoniobacterales bacterium]
MCIRVFLVFLSLFAGRAALSATELQQLNFGVISTESNANLRERWEPVLSDMAKAIGVPVKGFYVTDYNGVIEGMRFNKVQVAWLGNKSAMEAVDRSNAEIFAQMVHTDGTCGYYSVLIARKDHPSIKTLDDVFAQAKTLSFGNGDPNSTSGFLVPGYYLFSKRNVDPKQIFKIVTTNNHEGNLLAVLNHQLDVATCNTELFTKFEARFPGRISKEINVLWTSPMIPSDPLVYRRDLPEALKTRIRDFIFAYGKTPGEKANLKNVNDLSQFRPSSNDQLATIRQLELAKAKTAIQADTSLDQQTRDAKVREIDQKLENLNKLVNGEVR